MEHQGHSTENVSEPYDEMINNSKKNKEIKSDIKKVTEKDSHQKSIEMKKLI